MEGGAAEAGERVSQFVRHVIAWRLRGPSQPPAVEVTSGATRLLVEYFRALARTGPEAPASFVPDHPPLTARVDFRLPLTWGTEDRPAPDPAPPEPSGAPST